MELLKFINMAPDSCPSSRRINVIILFLMAIDATKKTGKKTSRVVFYCFHGPNILIVFVFFKEKIVNNNTPKW